GNASKASLRLDTRLSPAPPARSGIAKWPQPGCGKAGSDESSLELQRHPFREAIRPPVPRPTLTPFRGAKAESYATVFSQDWKLKLPTAVARGLREERRKGALIDSRRITDFDMTHVLPLAFKQPSWIG